MPNPNWVVNDVQVRDNYILRLWFEDGSVKDFDCSEIFNDKPFQPLRNKKFFAQAHIFADTVAWNEYIDIAPEYIYEYGKTVFTTNQFITEEEMDKRLSITQEDLDSIEDVEIE